MNRPIDVIIVGGGWSGMLACKHMIEGGLNPLVIEKRKSFGGVWRFSNDPEVATVMKTTETTSSRSATEMSDFPMKDEYGQFPKHDQILEYLKDYGDKFNIWQYFRYGQHVKKIQKTEDCWQVETNQATYQSKYLIVASGVHQTPNLEHMNEVFEKFSGSLQHAIQIKEIGESYRDQNILVYGGGETASDMVELLDNIAGRLVMSIPNGQHFFQKRKRPISPFLDWLVPGNYGEPLDKANSLMIGLVSPASKSKPGMAWACRKYTTNSVFGYQGHGIPQWKNRSEFFHAFINKNAAPVDLVRSGRLVAKGSIRQVEGKCITFDDGETLEFDRVIACTGYRPNLEFLDQETQKNTQCLYKYIFNPYDPTMAFVGLIRPIILSIPGLAELQAKAIMKVWSNQCQLPEKEKMISIAVDEKQIWNEYFKDTSNRIQNLMQPFKYIGDLHQTFAFSPGGKALFKRSPKLFFYVLTSPYHACFSLLNNSIYDHHVIRTLKRQTNLGWQIVPFGLAIARLLQVDRISNLIGDFRYKRQLKKMVWHKKKGAPPLLKTE